MLDSRQSRTLGKALSTGSLFGKASQEAGVEGAGQGRPGRGKLYSEILQKIIAERYCRGPAPVDPGNSKGGRLWRGKTCLFINIRLD